MSETYLRDGNAIYRRSFAIIRAETDLSRFSEEEADIAVRMVHACGSTDAAQYIQFGHGLVGAARAPRSTPAAPPAWGRGRVRGGVPARRPWGIPRWSRRAGRGRGFPPVT